MTQQDNDLRRWRLVLGKNPDGTQQKLSGQDKEMDDTLEALYGDKPQLGGGNGRGSGRGNRGGGSGRGQGGSGQGGNGQGNNKSGGMGESQPDIARWLGDIRKYFPASVVQVMQRDAIERLDFAAILTQPDLLELIEPDVHLVADLLSLSKVLPNETKDSARRIVQQVVKDLEQKIRNPMQQAITGSLNRAERSYRPRHHEINWHATIRRNLKHYQTDHKTIIPETLIGYGKRRSSMRDVILLIDQSGSMGTSVVYSSIFGAVMASMPALSTRMIVFDTSVVDLTEVMTDPVELLFGTQLGGGTDINRALGYAQQKITRPKDTIVVLISDLYEGGRHDQMLRRVHDIVASGAQMIALLALNDDGAPSYSHDTANHMKQLGVPAFACTPDQFPDLMAAAINRDDIGQWAARNDIVTAG